MGLRIKWNIIRLKIKYLQCNIDKFVSNSGRIGHDGDILNLNLTLSLKRQELFLKTNHLTCQLDLITFLEGILICGKYYCTWTNRIFAWNTLKKEALYL